MFADSEIYTNSSNNKNFDINKDLFQEVFIEKHISSDSSDNNFNYNADDEGNRILGVYFKDIVDIPLLDQNNERRVAAKIKFSQKKAKVANRLLKDNKQLTSKDILILSKLERLYSKKTDSLKKSFVKANLRFVIKIAKDYCQKGLPMSDLIQEGNLGLIRAVEKFDHLKGFKFSTYAAWWIKQFMVRSIMLKTKTVKTPAYVLERKNLVYRIKYALKEELGVEPEADQIAEKSGLTIFLVKKILQGTDNIYSLDRPIKYGDGEARSFLDMMAHDGTKNQDDLVAEKSMKKLILESLKYLDFREHEVLKLRYGLSEEGSHTLDQIGKKYGVSRERIRQIEGDALRKILGSSHGKILESFLE